MAAGITMGAGLCRKAVFSTLGKQVGGSGLSGEEGEVCVLLEEACEKEARRR